ncbi:hypothetical protein Tco_0128374 [Tanacetum coccineum]
MEHGTILALHNCSLEGNQNLIYGRVQVHTVNNGLIREDLMVNVKGKIHEVKVVEEIRDITLINIQDGNSRSPELNGEEEGPGDDDSVMQEDERENGGEDEEGDSDEDDYCEEEGEVGHDDDDVGGDHLVEDSGSRNLVEDETLRFLGETRVSETFKNDKENSKTKSAEKEYWINGKNRNREGNVKFDGDDLTGNILTSGPGEDVEKVNGPYIGLDVEHLVEDIINNKGNGSGGPTNVKNNNVKYKMEMGDDVIKKNDRSSLEGNMVGKVINEDQESVQPNHWREKREVSPSSSVRSGGDRLKKKRKASIDTFIVGI